MSNTRRQIVQAITASLMLVFPLWPAQSNLLVQEYCEMTLKITELAELEWKDRVLLAQSHDGSLKPLDLKLQALESQYGRLRSQLYAHYSMTLTGYLRYGASHQNAIKLYLEENAQVRGALDDANRRIESLRQQMESAMSARHAAGAKK